MGGAVARVLKLLQGGSELKLSKEQMHYNEDKQLRATKEVALTRYICVDVYKTHVKDIVDP